MPLKMLIINKIIKLGTFSYDKFFAMCIISSLLMYDAIHYPINNFQRADNLK